MLTFYQVEWCPACHIVRQTLTELGLTYTAVNVAADPDERAEVVAVSGQPSVPMLQDGDKVLRRFGRDRRVPAVHVSGAGRR